MIRKLMCGMVLIYGVFVGGNVVMAAVSDSGTGTANGINYNWFNSDGIERKVYQPYRAKQITSTTEIFNENGTTTVFFGTGTVPGAGLMYVGDYYDSKTWHVKVNSIDSGSGTITIHLYGVSGTSTQICLLRDPLIYTAATSTTVQTNQYCEYVACGVKVSTGSITVSVYLNAANDK